MICVVVVRQTPTNTPVKSTQIARGSYGPLPTKKQFYLPPYGRSLGTAPAFCLQLPSGAPLNLPPSAPTFAAQAQDMTLRIVCTAAELRLLHVTTISRTKNNCATPHHSSHCRSKGRESYPPSNSEGIALSHFPQETPKGLLPPIRFKYGPDSFVPVVEVISKVEGFLQREIAVKSVSGERT